MNAEKPTETAEIEFLHFQSRIFSEEFFAEAKVLLTEYFEKKPTLQNLSAYVVLPNQAVGLETFNLPNMPNKKIQLALDTELNNLYGIKHRNKKMNRFQICKNKQYSTWGIVYFDKTLVSNIYKLLTDVKVFPKQTTYIGNSLINSAFNFDGKLKNKSFIFADVHLDYTDIAVSSDGKTLGMATIPHGTLLIKNDKVELEYMQTNHEVGELAVINAREVAKAKALTLVEDDPSVIPEGATISDYAVDEQVPPSALNETQEESSEEKENPQDTAEESMPTETLDANATEESSQEHSAEGDEFFESEEEEQKRLAEEAERVVKKVKVYRKMPKRYPKFMVRSTPETAEGFQYENWRIIMKWILSYAREAALSEYISSPEFVVVNMPTELQHLLELSNQEQGEHDLKFQAFSLGEDVSPEIRGNLDLYGVLFAGRFNKNHNF